MGSLNTYLSPTVQTFIESLHLSSGSTNDITLLSAMSYMPTTNPFDKTSIKAAMANVTSIGSAAWKDSATSSGPTKTSVVNTSARNAAVAQILGTLGNAAIPRDDQVLDAIFLASRDSFLSLLTARIQQATGQAVNQTTKIDDQANPSYSLEELMKKLKDDISAKMPFYNADGSLIVDVTAFNRAATQIVFNDLRRILSNDDQRTYVFDQTTEDALMQFGLGPWLTLSFIRSFNTSADSTFFTQVYARYAMTQAAAVAVLKLADTYDQTATPPDANVARLQAVASNLQNVINTASSDYTPDMLSIMQSSALTKTNSQTLNTTNERLSSRLSRTKDLQVSFQVDDAIIRGRRRAFYAWLIALVAVVGASAFLIATSRLSAYLVLAAATLVIVGLYSLGLVIQSRGTR